MVNVIVADTKHDCSDLVGKFLDESHYDILVQSDTDCYMPPVCDISTRSSCTKTCSDCEVGKDERRVAFKFRKNYFPKDMQDMAYKGLREAALTMSFNRGMAGGPRSSEEHGRKWVYPEQSEILKEFCNEANSLGDFSFLEDIRQKYRKGLVENLPSGEVWLSERVREDGFDFDSWADSTAKLSPKERAKEARDIVNKYISKTSYANGVYSGIAGYMDRNPRFPYGRAAEFNRKSTAKLDMALPFLQTLAKGFQELMPWRYSNQIECVKRLDQGFVIPGTPFTTITVNKTFRTAAHYDAGDLSSGLSNLLVLSNDGNYTGGYLIFPEYRVAVDVRPGDLLLVNNHEILHGNTPIVIGSEQSERISIICYFREGMLNLGERKYEQYREDFITERSKNKSHKYWRQNWNGISPGCMGDNPKGDLKEAQEWFDWLASKEDGERYLDLYHPHYKQSQTVATLDSFFS